MAGFVTDYERSLIGSVLLSPERMAEAVSAGVDATWFTDDGWSLMWSALDGYWKRGEIEGVNPIAVRAEAQRLAAREKEHRVADRLTTDAIQSAIDSAGMGPLDVTIRLLRNCSMERRAKKAGADTFCQKNFRRARLRRDHGRV